jgi:DNA (cytosine-5)-methyltransferase 1
VKTWHLYCPDYGLPQHRERVFFVCVRDDLPGFPEKPEGSFFEPPTFLRPYRPIEAALEDLEPITDETVPNQSQYFVATKAPAGAGQGDQKNVRGRVAYAVRANPKARVHFHYELNRRLTVRECARLQSFPDEFVFPHSTSSNVLAIGNAVPPIIGHAVGRELAKWLVAQQALQKTARGRHRDELVGLPTLGSFRYRRRGVSIVADQATSTARPTTAVPVSSRSLIGAPGAGC